jgi:hypothetical protein
MARQIAQDHHGPTQATRVTQLGSSDIIAGPLEM